jgi:hypothetical protein
MTAMSTEEEQGENSLCPIHWGAIEASFVFFLEWRISLKISLTAMQISKTKRNRMNALNGS